MQKYPISKQNSSYFFNIIVPLFNAEQYIEKCLNSIIKQSYKKFHVQIVDDCSTDSSYDIASSICNKHKNFEIIKNPRRLGALNNIFNLLNKKIKKPSRTIDILIDGDDYLYSGDVLNILHEKYSETDCLITCLLYTSPSPRDRTRSRMPSSA